MRRFDARYYFWQFVHNCFVHFAMGVLCKCPDWLIRLHDYTAEKAWPHELATVRKRAAGMWNKVEVLGQPGDAAAVVRSEEGGRITLLTRKKNETWPAQFAGLVRYESVVPEGSIACAFDVPPFNKHYEHNDVTEMSA